MPLVFYERPTLATVFADQKNSEEDFIIAFKKEGEKQKQCSALVFEGAVTEAVAPGQHERHHQAPSPGTMLSISAPSCLSFELCL